MITTRDKPRIRYVGDNRTRPRDRRRGGRGHNINRMGPPVRIIVCSAGGAHQRVPKICSTVSSSNRPSHCLEVAMPANVRITVPERMEGVKGNEEAKDIFPGVKGRGGEKGCMYIQYMYIYIYIYKYI